MNDTKWEEKRENFTGSLRLAVKCKLREHGFWNEVVDNRDLRRDTSFFARVVKVSCYIFVRPTEALNLFRSELPKSPCDCFLSFQFNEVLTCFTQNMSNVQVPLNIKLWRTSGCHELLASLGFDLIGVGKAEVMLRSGKPNSRRALQCTVQALCGLTGQLVELPQRGTTGISL